MIKVVPCKAKINTDAIKLLEDTLEKVKSGELVSVGVAWVTKDGSISGDVSKGNNGILMWASLEHNAKRFYTDVLLSD